MPLGQQRDTIQKLSPPWLATGDAEKFLYVIGLALDVLLEKLNQAMKAHMPGQGTATADPLLAVDRGLVQGLGESHESFSARLSRAFESWSRAGDARVVLEQVLSFLQGPAFPFPAPLAAIVGGVLSRKWNLFYYGDDFSGESTYIHEATPNWDWDGVTTHWWRSWLVLYSAALSTGNTGATASVAAAVSGFVTVTGLSGMSSADVGRWLEVSGAADVTNNDGVFQIAEFISATSVKIGNPAGTLDANNGALVWDVGAYQQFSPAPVCGTPGLTCGTSVFSCGFYTDVTQTFATVRQLLNTWKSRQTFYMWIVVAFSGRGGQGGADYSPYSTDTTGDHNPDGTWKNWSKTVAGQRVSARVTKTYLDLGRTTLDAFVPGTGRYGGSYEYIDC